MIAKLLKSYTELIMDTRKGITDIIAMSISQGVGFIIGTLTSIIIARVLGPSEMGKYSLIMSISTFILAITDLGITTTTVRYASMAIARNNENGFLSILRWSLKLRLLILLLISVFVYFLSPYLSVKVWHIENLSSLIRLSLITVLFMIISSISNLYLQSKKRFKLNSTITISYSLMSIGGIVFLYYIDAITIVNLIMLGIAVTLIITIIAALLFIPFEAFIKINPVGNIGLNLKQLFAFPAWSKTGEGEKKNDIKSYWIFSSLMSFAYAISIQMDLWIIGAYFPTDQLGLYSVGLKYTLPLSVFIGVMNMVVWPRITRLSRYRDIIDAFKKMLKFGLPVFVLFVLFSIFAPLLTPQLFGEVYEKSTVYGQVLCIKWCIALVTAYFSIICYHIGLMKIISLIFPFTVCFWAATYILIIPSYGALGVAVAIDIAEFLWFLVVLVLFCYKIKRVKMHEELGLSWTAF